MTSTRRFVQWPAVLLVALVVVVGAPAAGGAPAPVTGEVRVNATTVGDQTRGSAAMDGLGNFVVAWGDHVPPAARVFNRAGVPLTGEIGVEVSESGVATEPSVGMDAAGRFAVVWEDEDAENDGNKVRLFDAAGVPTTGEILVNTTTDGDQDEPALAMDADGDFVVAWESCPSAGAPVGQDGDDCGAFARVFDDAGVPVTGEIPVNTTTTGSQEDVAVAMNALGDFVVAWDGGDCQVHARAFDASGAASSSEIQASGSGDCNIAPAVAMDADSEFVVAWDGLDETPCCAETILARRFGANGTPVSGELTVHTPTFESQAADDPGVAMDADGGFMVAWTGSDDTAFSEGVFARRFNAADGPVAGETRVNATVAGDQHGEDPQGTPVAANHFRASEAATRELAFVVAWSGNGPGDDVGMFARVLDDDSEVECPGYAGDPRNDVVGTERGETLVGTAGVDIICGLGGDDTLLGQAGNDLLLGGFGNDTLKPGSGADRNIGGGGTDTVVFSATGAAVVANIAAGNASGQGADVLATVENLTGTAGRDTLTGNGSVNVLKGLGGVDVLKGLAGGDLLNGGVGNDTLNGGTGVDTCVAGGGTDTRVSCEA